MLNVLFLLWVLCGRKNKKMNELWCRFFVFQSNYIAYDNSKYMFYSRRMQMSCFRARHSWRNVYLHVLTQHFLFIVRFPSYLPVKSNCMPVGLMAFISSSWKFYCGLFIPILPLPRYIGYIDRHQHLCQAHAK